MVRVRVGVRVRVRVGIGVTNLDDDGGDVPDPGEVLLLEQPSFAREEAGHAIRAGEVVVLNAREGQGKVGVGPPWLGAGAGLGGRGRVGG